MGKYVFSYHGGGMPETEEEQARVMSAWQSWMADLGGALLDGGNAIMLTKTVNANGTITDGGGANPVTGYSIVEADSLDGAAALAKGCPILESGGSVEVGETIDM